MSTINNFKTTSLVNRGGLISNRNISNIQAQKNATHKPGISFNNKKPALSQSTNTLNNGNFKLNFKSTGNNLKKSLVSITENENVGINKIGFKEGIKKSKIPKLSPSKTKSKLLNAKNSAVIKTKNTKKTESLSQEHNLIKFSSFKIPINVENIDLNDHKNVQLAPEFSNDIYMYLNHLEEKCKIKSDLLKIQKHMTSKMRARLIDWIIAVHHKFKLLPETLYLSIAIMDRYLEKINVAKDKMHLVGLTAFFIACKFEEIYPPEIKDFLTVCDAYSKDEIIKMEITILKTLDFNLSYPLPLHFLRRFSKAAYADQEIHTLAKYLMESSLVEYECSSWKPSLLAAASLYLTLEILSNEDEPKWTDTLAFYTNYKENDLKPYVSILCKILILTKDSKLQTVNKKYSSLKLLNISQNPKLMCDYVLKMSEKCI